MATGARRDAVSRHTEVLARHVAAAADDALPEPVAAKTRLHLLDSVAAVVSGSRLRAGRLAASYAALLGGAPVATVVGTGTVTSAVNAALANGMMGHADETDDSHLAGRFHPGCAIVPAALAVAEQVGADGAALLRAVALGYDVGARVNISLGYARPDTTRHSTHSIGPCFGATAAACLLRLDETQVRHALSYAAQQASGIPFWQRDAEHVEKAFDFGGMGARNGVTAATMVAAGFTAVDDPLSGRHNLFTALGESPNPERLIEDLGTRFEIMRASIKKWTVGSPTQAALDALVFLMGEHGVDAANARGIVAHMPDDRLHIVDDRAMPDVCLQHLLAVTLLDGGLLRDRARPGAHGRPRRARGPHPHPRGAVGRADRCGAGAAGPHRGRDRRGRTPEPADARRARHPGEPDDGGRGRC